MNGKYVDQILQGDALETLKKFPDRFVRSCITSPPYWRLRDYRLRDQIGLERDPREYILKLASVFNEVKRILTDDGTLWLILGDSYATGKGTCRNPGGGSNSLQQHLKSAGVVPLDRLNKSDLTRAGLKPKDLVGIPWMAAFALRETGWFLRSDIIWNKRKARPESVRDRPSLSHEHIFLLTKSARYFYDRGKETNRRSVWDIDVEVFNKKHFSTFPTDLITPCILAGSAEGDIILDPFSGIGTTAIQSLQLGRHFIGIDLDSNSCNTAREEILKTKTLLAGVA